MDGERARIKVKKGLEPEGNNTEELYFPQWYTWKMHFDADERIKVVNKYWMVNSSGGEDSEWFDYILRSGATWKGSIGKVTVRVQMEDYDMSDTAFEQMKPTYIEEGGTIVWEAENIEPEQDINISTCYTPYSSSGGNPYDDTPQHEAYGKMVIRMMRNFYAGHYNGVTWWGNKLLRKF